VNSLVRIVTLITLASWVPATRADDYPSRPVRFIVATAAGGNVDAEDTEVTVDRTTEEELLKGLEGLTPPEEQPEEEE